jgi:hypothetical protein
MNSLMLFKRTIASVVIVLVLASFGLLPTAPAVNPPPPGGYATNTAAGNNALEKLTTGTHNIAIGRRTLFATKQGNFNTAVGAAALDANVNGVRNTATGYQALTRAAAGSDNTANGQAALAALNTGGANTALGSSALINLTNGNGNIAIGRGAGSTLTTGNNNIYIGNAGIAAESNTIRIGSNGIGQPPQSRTFIDGISGVGVAGAAVSVNAQGQLGTLPSSLRFKEEIKPIGNASETIFALEPVTFRYKKDINPENTPQFGLVAEDVEKVDPDLVVRDKEGKPYSVRYDQVNAMLLNEFLKTHRRIEQQRATIVRHQEQIDALTAGLQKVSAELELTKPAPQRVLMSR